MRDMSPTEIREFLRHSTRTAKLATVSAGGHPHVVPVWFVLDGDQVVMTIPSSTAKARNLLHEPRVSLCVDDESPPFAFVTLFGKASLESAPSDLVNWTTRIARRYLGDAAAEEAGLRFAEIDDLLVRLSVDKAVGRAEIAA